MLEICHVILVTPLKMDPHNRHSSRENVTGPSSGTSLVVIRRKCPIPLGQKDPQTSSQ